MSVRVRGELFNKLDKAARDHDRPLGHEVELRLEASFAPPHPLVSNEDVVTALLFLAAYGPEKKAPSVVHWLANQPAENDVEWCLRLLAMESEIASQRARHPERFETFAREFEKRDLARGLEDAPEATGRRIDASRPRIAR